MRMTNKAVDMVADNDQGFIIVKFGDNEQAIFNPCCTNHTLLEWIRKKSRSDEDIIIDLVDLEGQVRNLSGRPREYANEMVSGRETYVLIRVEKYSDGKFHYTSLLNNLEEYNPDLMVKLNSMSRPQTKGPKNKKGKNNPKQQLKVRQESSSSKRPTSSEKKKK